MYQNFPLMKSLIPLLFQRKTITNRALIKPDETGVSFRDKCDVGDLMYFWDNYRQKGMKLVGIGYVLKTTEWNIDQIPKKINEAMKIDSPLEMVRWDSFAWLDGFDYYNTNQIYFKLKIDETELESQLRQEFEEQTGKHAIWNGRITKNYTLWKLFRIPNFVDYFTHHTKKVKDFKMYLFREAQEKETPVKMYERLMIDNKN